MRGSNNKIWNTMAVITMLSVGVLNGCCGSAVSNVENFDMQPMFTDSILNEGLLSSNNLNDATLSDVRDYQTGVVKENGLNTGTENAATDEYDTGEKTQALAAENAPEAASEVTLIMVGDVLLHTPVAKSGVQRNGSYDFTALFANVKDEIAAADLALVNQEVIIGGAALGVTGYPSFNAPYELGDALVEAGFDVVLHATNHTLDKGKKGVTNCLSFWAEQYPQITVLGINESQEAQDHNIFVYEQEGIRIAVLNYTYGTNGIPMPSGMPYAVNLLEEKRLQQT